MSNAENVFFFFFNVRADKLTLNESLVKLKT